MELLSKQPSVKPAERFTGDVWYDVIASWVYFSHFVAALGVAVVLWLRRRSLWAAFMRRDRGWDGRIIGAVKSTGIYCKPSCPARRPRRENVEFFVDPDEAVRELLRTWRPGAGSAATTLRSRSGV